MNRPILVSDYFYPDYSGGAEIVDHTIAYELDLEMVTCRNLAAKGYVDPATMYLLSNTYQMPSHLKNIFCNFGNYCIMEHDYKFHISRQPNKFPNNIVPKNQRINLDYYSGAHKVFLQSLDHERCFQDNEIPGTFQCLSTSIWSTEELDYLLVLEGDRGTRSSTVAITDNPHPDKGTKEAIAFCKDSEYPYDLIAPMKHKDFLAKLSTYNSIAYFPKVKESFCRLVVEAKCLGMTVHTTNTYGVTSEPWFHKYSGKELVGFLRQGSKEALVEIAKALKL
jgi:hypothetical protein